MHKSLIASTAAILCCLTAMASLASAADVAPMRLWLKNGSYVEGRLVTGDAAGYVGFKSDLFREKIDFDIRGVRSVAGDTLSNDQLSGHFFLLASGTRISGDLKSWSDDSVVIKSPTLGEVELSRSDLRLIEAAEDGGKRVYTGPRSIDDWTILDSSNNWEFAAGSLTALNKQARAVGDVRLPEKFRLNLSMSWEGRADFVLSLGSSKPKKQAAPKNNANRRLVEKQSQEGAAVRLEMWDAQLAVVREIGNLADIAVLPLDDDTSRFELTIYVDQIAGLVAVYSMRGRLLEKIQVAEEKGSAREFAMLENHGRKVSLDNFDVYSWDGHLPNSTEYPEGYILDTEENVIHGSVTGYDVSEKSLTLVNEDGKEQKLKLENLRRLVISKDEAEENPDAAKEESGKATETDKKQEESEDASEPDADVDADDADEAEESEADSGDDSEIKEEVAEKEEKQDAKQDTKKTPKEPEFAPDPSRLIEVEFEDSSRLVGEIQSSKAGTFLFRAQGVSGTVSCKTDQVVAIIGSELKFDGEPIEGARGTLVTEDTKLYGSLNENASPDGDAVMIWKAWASKKPAAIAGNANGKIEYVKGRVSAVVAKPNNQQRVVRPKPAGVGALLGGIFGGDGNVQPRPAQAAAKKPSDLPKYEIVFRSGDSVDGAVTMVDEKGIHFDSDETTTKIVGHDQMDSVTLTRISSRAKFTEEKMTRLMTVPRSMKNDPPTHLFIAKNGDYLRGRLVALDAETVTMEVRLAVKEVPRDNISRIIWLHERPWLDKKEEAAGDAAEKVEPGVDAKPPFLVHAVRPNKRGVTFSPRKLVEGRLVGESELLGECSVDLTGINALLFGSNVGKEALALRKESWVLSLATLPKVYQETEDGSGTLGVPSDLVGRVAPGIRLKTIAGEPFDLKDLRGKVVVLDFWASWCGPCIATMPKVDAIVEEFDEIDVELVAVNLQDSVARAELAIKRMDLKGTVVMDTDGETGRFYDARAIPQTVIVDREGKITHLFVGGGNKFLDQFSTALKMVVSGEKPAEAPAAP